ncbi:hypothetical protein CEG14_05570 [Bordetella genomosp. 1]|uniref:Uncharacterized protein n=1 Tax=Bordetella genomosp. 1 TaxID=1395607 RepID=A0A261SPE3_9BORD|nr:ERF family protein [Bordetella genomosp. 1]OZI39005.1 hypothetical protein CEG14_05570 [Bordetella genomosp. 1]
MTEVIDAQARAVAPKPDQVAGQVAVLPANSPMGMMMAAVKQGIPLEQVREMMAIQREWEADEARKAFNDAFAAFKAEKVEVIKRKQVDFATSKGRTQYKHAELSDLVDAVGPALARHGFSWSWTPEQKNARIYITCTLQHRLGHEKSATLDAPADDSGGKNIIQSIVSTTTYLERHTLKAVCGISEKGDDNDANSLDAPAQQAVDSWIQAAKNAQSIAELDQVWRDGLLEIKKTNSLKVYDDFRAAVSEAKSRMGAS